MYNALDHHVCHIPMSLLGDAVFLALELLMYRCPEVKARRLGL